MEHLGFEVGSLVRVKEDEGLLIVRVRGCDLSQGVFSAIVFQSNIKGLTPGDYFENWHLERFEPYAEDPTIDDFFEALKDLEDKL